MGLSPSDYERTNVFIQLGGQRVQLVVSTVYLLDCGYETAIIGEDVYPVEYYPDAQTAHIGHQKWVESLPNLTEITRSGHGDSIAPKTFTMAQVVGSI